MNTSKVKCEYCKNSFEKLNKEINRTKKRKKKNFCSKNCACIYRNKLMTKDFWQKQYKNNPTLKGYEGNRKDELSPFRIYLNKGRASIIKHKDDIDIDVNYLKELWKSQNGICPYTGIKMILPESSSRYHKIKSLKKASLDRIDSSKGYLRGNVEFVCYAINLAKNNHTKKDLINFLAEFISVNTLGVTQAQPT